MASSTLFRGRRIVDPVPVQRGPLPRDGKYQTSFSGSAFGNLGVQKEYAVHSQIIVLTLIYDHKLIAFQRL